MGISDNLQAVLVAGSVGLIALGAYSVPSGMPNWIAPTFFVLGAIGFALKEALGNNAPLSSAQSALTATPSVASNPNTVTSQNQNFVNGGAVAPIGSTYAKFPDGTFQITTPNGDVVTTPYSPIK